MTDIVLNRSRDVMQVLVLYEYCSKSKLSDSRDYDVLKQVSEHFEYFESFQLKVLNDLRRLF